MKKRLFVVAVVSRVPLSLDAYSKITTHHIAGNGVSLKGVGHALNHGSSAQAPLVKANSAPLARTP